MANVLTDIAVWSEAAEAAWFDRWANPDYEPGSEPGLTCTDMVMQRLELFGTPYRDPLIPRHEPASVLIYDEVERRNVPLSERALMALHAKPLSKKEIRQRRREADLELQAVQARLKHQHFAADLPPLPPSEPRVRDKMFRALFQSQLTAFQAE